MTTDKDLQYWRQRLENEDFLRRQMWFWRHFRQGTLKSQRERAARELALTGEAQAAQMVRALGYQAHFTTHNCPFDLWVTDDQGRAARVEVKTSLYRPVQTGHGGGRFQANIRQHRDVDVVLFLAKNGAWWPYVIPVGAIGRRANIAIWSACPGDYRGQWSIYLNAWDHLAQAIQNTHVRAWQLGLSLDARRN